MIGLLRFVGLVNAAVWFGAAVFFALGVAPVATGPEMLRLLGANNAPYYGGAIGHMFMMRYFSLHLVCSLVALAHLAGEWLYLSKRPGRFIVSLLSALLLVGILGAYWIQPRLARLHTVAHATNVNAARQQQARASLETWHSVYSGVDFLVLCGLGYYLWRVSNPSDPTRFVSATKFRG